MNTFTGKKTWHVFECTGPARHRSLRREDKKPLECGKCGKAMHHVNSVDKKDDETDNFHLYRSLAARQKVVVH